VNLNERHRLVFGAPVLAQYTLK